MNKYLDEFRRTVSNYHRIGTQGKPDSQGLSSWVSELARKYKETGNPREKEKLILSNSRGAAKRVISCYQRGVCNDYEVMDYFHECLAVMDKVADRFDPDRGFTFLTYAWSYIMQSTTNYARKNKRIVQQCKHSIYQSMAVRVRVEDEKKKARTGDGLTLEEVNKMLDAVSRKTRDALIYMLNSNDCEFSGDLPGMNDDECLPIEDAIDARSIAKALRGMGGLDERETDIVNMRILADVPATLEELGQKHGLSRERIRQIEKSFFQRLRDSIAA